MIKSSSFENSSMNEIRLQRERSNVAELNQWQTIPMELEGRVLKSFHQLSILFPETPEFTQIQPITSNDLGGDSFEPSAGILYIRYSKNAEWAYVQKVAYLCKSCKRYIVGPPKFTDLEDERGTIASTNKTYGSLIYLASCINCKNSLLNKKHYL